LVSSIRSASTDDAAFSIAIVAFLPEAIFSPSESNQRPPAINAEPWTVSENTTYKLLDIYAPEEKPLTVSIFGSAPSGGNH